VLEEPPARTVFHIVVSNGRTLLPTVLSRVARVDTPAATESEYAVATAFVKTTLAERLDEIAARAKEGDRVWARTLLQELQQLARLRPELQSQQAPVLAAEQMLNGAGSSLKMILEWVAVQMPVLK